MKQVTNVAVITPQAAAIPIREDGSVCLVTSAGGRHWGIPKGMIDPGKTAEETALEEAWEEAGVTGELENEPVGSFRYQKWGLNLEASVYILRISEVHDTWPEKLYRQRKWVAQADAANEIDRPELKELLESVIPEGR